jgi:poly(3-hydroxybutyrate) depolymerase
MLATLKGSYCIDESNVFVAGFSWGCDQVVSLACCRGSSIRAMAAASCTDEFNNAADYRTYVNSPCPSNPAMGVRFTYDSNGDGPYSAQQFSSTRSLFRSWNQCSTTSAPAGGACSSYQGCTQPFLDCKYPGMGHTLPTGWASDTWSFFSTF